MTVRTLLLVIASLAAAGCGAAQDTSGPIASRPGVIVPWLDRPAPAYSFPPPRPLHYPTRAPSCRATQIRAALLRSGVGLGNVLERFGFTNIGSTPCLLRGFPQVMGVVRGNLRKVPVRSSPSGTYFGMLQPADMSPGGRVLLDLATTDVCDVARLLTFTHLRFRLPGGGWVRARGVLPDACGLPMTLSSFGLPAGWAPPPRRPGTPDVLRLGLALPRSVTAGRVLRYTISLSNPTASDVSLSPCPSYTEMLFDGRRRIEHSFRLNCSEVREIPAHGRVRYAMELPLPRNLPAWWAKIGWYLNTPADLVSGGALSVVR
ncbi:MAG: DUF4232 domain-containing protein [Gaiellales bacterium]